MHYVISKSLSEMVDLATAAAMRQPQTQLIGRCFAAPKKKI